MNQNISFFLNWPNHCLNFQNDTKCHIQSNIIENLLISTGFDNKGHSSKYVAVIFLINSWYLIIGSCIKIACVLIIYSISFAGFDVKMNEEMNDSTWGILYVMALNILFKYPL